MLIQLDWWFWFCAFAIFVAIRLRTSLPASSWWGGLNFAALALLLGLNGIAMVGGFTVALWMLLRFALNRKERPTGIYAIAAAAIGVGLILIWQKVLFEVATGNEPGTPFIGTVRLLELVAYSYISLRAWDAISAVANGERLLNPLGLSGYLAPFFMMPAGPINVYRDHLEIDERDAFAPPSWIELLRGAELIVSGLFMKFVLAEVLRLFVVGVNGSWPTAGYGDSLVTFLYIYFDFAGYSLIALGIGTLLGVPTPINFDRPLLATSLTDFWTRWHMSLGDWIKRNLYFPLQIFFMRRTPDEAAYLVNTLSLMAGFTFVGLWHRITFPFLVWGVLFGCLLSAEKVIRDRIAMPFLDRHPRLMPLVRVIAPVYVVTIVVAMLHLTAMSQMVGNAE